MYDSMFVYGFVFENPINRKIPKKNIAQINIRFAIVYPRNYQTMLISSLYTICSFHNPKFKIYILFQGLFFFKWINGTSQCEWIKSLCMTACLYMDLFLHYSNICCLKGITCNGISVSKYNKFRQCYVIT
jgi:hypothetical protein